MPASVRGQPLTMVRPDLLHIPQFRVPAPFALHWYRPGDEAAWKQIHDEADPFNTFTDTSHARCFGTDTEALMQRQCFLCDESGRPAGTASAWYGVAPFSRRWGRVHWVAVMPPFQGRGLGQALLAAVCERLRELGHERAYLNTDTRRAAAISLYLKFGFRRQ